MKRLILFFISLSIGCLLYGQQSLPHLADGPGGRQLIVGGEPFTMLAGELHNSSTGSLHAMEGLWKKMADRGLNTVIAAASWELCEPVEGHFDFSLVDAMLEGARAENLKLVLLWFGSWKNGNSTYVPAWVKLDQKRFPLAQTLKGNKLNAVSALGENTMRADARAFAALMRHLKEVDGAHQTVVLVQVENEIGTLLNRGPAGDRASRDFSPVAEKAFHGMVPAALTAYLKKHEKELQPAVRDAWQRNGRRMDGTWEQVFGPSEDDPSEDWQHAYPYLTDEIFNAWNYASYVGHIAAEGKIEYALPMYVNDWLKQPGQGQPGQYPSGAAVPHMFDIWRAAAPAIDFYAPDIYATGVFDWVLQTHGSQGNPIFIPETEGSAAGASRALYAFGKYPLMGYSPFGIDGGRGFLSVAEDDLSYNKVYAALRALLPFIQQYRGTDRITGFFLSSEQPQASQTMGKYTVSASMSGPSVRLADLVGADVEMQQRRSASPTGVLVIQVGTDEFIVAGGVGGGRVSFSRENARVEWLSVDQLTFDEQGRELRHRLNGDETGMGLSFQEGEVGIYRVRLYEL